MNRSLGLHRTRDAARRFLLAVTLAVVWTLGVGAFGHIAAANPPLSSAPVAAPEIHGAWPHDISDLTPDPSLTFGRLANGFRYVVMENQRPQDRVSLHLFVRAGSLQETESQQGLAHFLEHMLFNGSTHFPPGELVRYFQSIGMQFGDDANAHTGFEETVYDIVLPGGDRETLENGLLVMRDYADGALLLEEEIERESSVILAEMRSRDSAGYRTFKAALEFELPDMLFPRRLPIGRADIIKTADRKQLKSFYDTWYRPDNMILVMVGDVSTPLAQGLIASRFSDLAARGSAPVAPPETGTIDHRGLKVFYHHEPESGGTTVSIETVRASDPAPDSRDLQQRQMLASMADRIVQYRLDARLKSPGAAFTSAAVGSGVYLGRIRYAEMTADSRADNWQQTLAALEQELRRAKHYGFGQAEVDRVKKETLKQLDDAVLNAPTRNSTALARGIIGHLARNRVFQSPLQERDVLAPVVANATVDELNQRFRDNWPEDHRLVLVSGNASLADAPSAAAEIIIRNAFLASAGRVVAPPRPKAVASFPYLPVPLQSGAVASREDLADLGITRIQFDNGVRLHVKQTDYKANEVLANLIFGEGKSSEPESLPGLALLAQATVNESGLGGMSTDELDQGLAGKSTEVDFRIDESRFSFVVESVSDEIELLFQLLYAHLTDPGFRSDALTLSKQRLHQRYLSSSRAIDGMMHIQGRRFLAGGDSRFGMPPLTQINAIGLDDVRRWIAPQLAHAPVELSVVGDVDVQRVVDLAGQYLGSLPPRRAADTAGLRAAGPSMPVGQTRRIQVDTQIPKAMVVAAWQTDDFWDIHRTRRLSVLADVFSERLRQRIRERLGASYSPYAFNHSSRAYTGYGVFQAHISVAPHEAATVLQEVRAIAHDLASEPIAGDELDRALDPILNAIDVLRQTNGYWLDSVMTGSARHPQQYEWARSFVDDYAAVTVGELEALAARYLTEERAAAIIITPDGGDRMSGIGSPKTDAGGQAVEGG